MCPAPNIKKDTLYVCVPSLGRGCGRGIGLDVLSRPYPFFSGALPPRQSRFRPDSSPHNVEQSVGKAQDTDGSGNPLGWLKSLHNCTSLEATCSAGRNKLMRGLHKGNICQSFNHLQMIGKEDQ